MRIILFLIILILGCHTLPYDKWSNRNFIYYVEIKESKSTTVYDLIIRNRPFWLSLNKYGSETIIYLDNMIYGNIYSMYDIYTGEIVEIEFISYRNSFIRFGSLSGNKNVISITTGTY